MRGLSLFEGARIASAVGPAPLGLVRRDLFGRGMHGLLESLDLELIGQVERLVIESDVILEDVGNGRLLKDGLPGALGLAGAAIDAFVGIDIELVGKALAVVTDIFV